MPTATKESKPAAAPAITKDALHQAQAKAAKAVEAQPKRSEAKLTEAQAKKAFDLGKAIAADVWRLKHAVAGKTSAKTVESMVARIVANVEARNALRKEKKQ